MQKQTDKWDIFTADDLHISSNRVIIINLFTHYIDEMSIECSRWE